MEVDRRASGHRFPSEQDGHNRKQQNPSLKREFDHGEKGWNLSSALLPPSPFGPRFARNNKKTHTKQKQHAARRNHREDRQLYTYCLYARLWWKNIRHTPKKDNFFIHFFSYVRGFPIPAPSSLVSCCTRTTVLRHTHAMENKSSTNKTDPSGQIDQPAYPDEPLLLPSPTPSALFRESLYLILLRPPPSSPQPFSGVRKVWKVLS